ncbi:CopG family transcriptional regulator [Halobellus inordinatus]|uniref:CopG family transcriptional regulator n=1 Tax=Halobellus inordinatus TaxID=1126236 RepID=UPI00210D82A0|nr:CopG family transcriptional regulator [Halobellus inordinatus]
MGSEGVDGLPEELDSWVADRAAATDTSRADVLRRLLAAHRLLDEHPEALEDPESIDVTELLGSAPDTNDDTAVSAEVDALTADVAEMVARINALEDDLDEKITDVRERVIQVKRETDAKAPEDHDHPDIERRLRQGFENYEEILEYLTETTDDHDAKLDTVASAIVDLRGRIATLERDSNERAAAADLRREANRQGVAEAVCESCGESVHLGLLDSPFCPHCESTFDGVEPKRGFFGSHRLTVGQRPALEAPTESASAGAERDGLFDDESRGAEDTSGARADGSTSHDTAGEEQEKSAAAEDVSERDTDRTANTAQVNE